MGTISMLISYIYMAVAAVVIAGIVLLVCFVLFLSNKNKNKNIKEEDMQPRLNYDTFERRDSTEYVKFEDIVDFGWGGAIVTDNGTRFIAGLQIIGYDYDMASAEERYQSLVGMQQMTNVISSPIQIQQDSRKVDLTESIRQCEDKIEALLKNKDSLIATQYELEGLIQNLRSMESHQPAAIRHYEGRIDFVKGELTAIEHMVAEQEALICELKRTSGEAAQPIRTHKYLVDWIYDPANFSTRALAGADIYKEAQRRLRDKVNILSRTLSKAGVKVHRMSCEELLLAQHHHFHPYSSSSFRIDEIMNSSYIHLFTTADNEDMYHDMMAEKENYLLWQQQMETELAEEAERQNESMSLRKKLIIQYQGEIDKNEDRMPSVGSATSTDSTDPELVKGNSENTFNKTEDTLDDLISDDDDMDYIV